MEMKSPPPCPATVTIRRNPHRKARPTPSSAIPLREPLSSPSLSRDIFANETAQNPNNAELGKTDSPTTSLPENLKVFLRIRPPIIQKTSRTIAESKNAWPKNPKLKSNARPKTKKSTEICVQASEDLHSVTVSTPQPLQEMKRIKSEVYEGFSYVFSAESSQNDVYEEMVKPLVEDFSKGKSGMLAALGPSGSGKTHTVFGSAREPGMVPLALRRIFSQDESSVGQSSRVIYLSMFEISSERGKNEKMIDLLHDGGDVSLQHSILKGLREAVVYDAQQAESLIAHGMLKRATATTNSNSQSSRSQCIINIRSGTKQGGEEVDGNESSTTLTIVDLAGAEREKKTGNQGARLLESNFINNTSMVFGQCLRSLLEHQKNRNKILQKHYKNSLLTRYLRDYLEGKKRMMLILTVKPGVEDYLDTSFLLRQASPFAKIKFKTVEEPINLTNKRPNQALPQAGQLKKMKFGNNEISLINEGKTDRCFPENLYKEIPVEAIEGSLDQNIQENDENIKDHALSNGFSGLGIQPKLLLKGNDSKLKVKKEREYRIMQGLSKALWNILKQYKEKLEGVEIENCHLRDSLANEKTRSLDLKNELNNEKMRTLDLENEVKELKSRCTCSRPSSNVFRVSTHGSNFDVSQYQMAETLEVKSDILSPSMRGLEMTENEKTADPSARDSVGNFASCSDGGHEQHPQHLEDLIECKDDTENAKGSRGTSKTDTCFRSKVLSPGINSSRELVCCEYMGTVDIPCTSEAAIQSTSGSVYISHKSEQDALKTVADVKNLESESECALDGSCLVASLEYESDKNTRDHEDLKDAKEKQELTQLQNGMTAIQSTSGSLYISHKSEQNALNIVEDVKNLESEDEYVLNGSCLVGSLEYESHGNTHDLEDPKDAKAKQELTQLQNGMTAIQSTSGSLYISHKSEQNALNIVGDVKNLELESECVPNKSCLVDSLEYESNENTLDHEDQKDAKAKQELTQLQSCMTAIQSASGSLYISHKSEQNALNIVGELKNLESESECVLNGSCLVDSLEYESDGNTHDHEDLKDAKAKQELTRLQNGITAIQLTSGSLYTSHKCEQDALNIVGGVKSLELESEYALNGSCLMASLEYESNRKTQDHKDLKDAKAKQELTQLQNDIGTSLVVEENLPMAAHLHADLKSSESRQIGDTDRHVNFADNDTSLVQEQNVPMSDNLHADLKSSRSPRNGDTCNHVKEEGTLKPLGSILPKEGPDAQNKPKSHKVASCSNQLTEKPRRRLQPASSLLLKDLSMLDIKDENDKPKGAKAGKKATSDEKSRTQGSLSLLNLLTKKLDR